MQINGKQQINFNILNTKTTMSDQTVYIHIAPDVLFYHNMLIFFLFLHENMLWVLTVSDSVGHAEVLLMRIHNLCFL